METVVSADYGALRGRRVFLTGHTGFKGSWLLLWLHRLGAIVTGYSLAPDDDSMYERLSLESLCDGIVADIRDRERLREAIEGARPEIVFHLAAQALVLPSYDDPLGTIATNVVGTANLLDIVRANSRPCTIVVATSDKCYENRDWVYGYRETDSLGGHDIYSVSKAAAELVTAGFRRSFFATGEQVRVATVRAGNVIGGGDRAAGRIVPDCIRALESGEPIAVRNPRHVRPWQHVLEPLSGYLTLATRLCAGATELCDAWNFAPGEVDARSVEDLVDAIIGEWGSGRWIPDQREQPREAPMLRIVIDKARAKLGWQPRWSFDEAVSKTVEWYRAEHEGASEEALRDLTISQIEAYEGMVVA